MQKHKESRAAWIEIASQARKLLQERAMTPCELEKFADIDYHAARRILLDGLNNQTKSAIKVCIKLGVMEESEKVQKLCLNDIHQVLNECWDGNGAQAELLIKLIRSTANLKIHYP